MHEDRVRIDLDGEDRVARLTLARGAEGNAIDLAMVAGLDAAVTAVERALLDEGPDVRPRALLVAADGRAFTVGGDLAHIAAHVDGLARELAAMVEPFNAILGRLADLPIPVVAAVGGPIAGGGIGIAYGADVVVASPDARFACGFARLGLSGDGASTWWLPRLVGLRRAQEMTIRGRVVDGEEALDWGLVSEVVPAEELQARAEAIAAELAAGPTVALGAMRRLLRDAYATSLDGHHARELVGMTATGATADAREGVTSFVERRPPRFLGR